MIDLLNVVSVKSVSQFLRAGQKRQPGDSKKSSQRKSDRPLAEDVDDEEDEEEGQHTDGIKGEISKGVANYVRHTFHFTCNSHCLQQQLQTKTGCPQLFLMRKSLGGRPTVG